MSPDTQISDYKRIAQMRLADADPMMTLGRSLAKAAAVAAQHQAGFKSLLKEYYRQPQYFYLSEGQTEQVWTSMGALALLLKKLAADPVGSFSPCGGGKINGRGKKAIVALRMNDPVEEAQSNGHSLWLAAVEEEGDYVPYGRRMRVTTTALPFGCQSPGDYLGLFFKLNFYTAGSSAKSAASFHLGKRPIFEANPSRSGISFSEMDHLQTFVTLLAKQAASH